MMTSSGERCLSRAGGFFSRAAVALFRGDDLRAIHWILASNGSIRCSTAIANQDTLDGTGQARPEIQIVSVRSAL